MTPPFSTARCFAIITGASSGLGAEFARQLAPMANGLVLAARRGEVLEQVKAELLALRPALTVATCACDIATEEGRATLLACVDAQPMKPNLLINNAGVGDYGSFEGASVERLAGQIELNITALVLLTHALLPRLEHSTERPAGVLNVSSLAGNLPMPDLAVYAATKAFVTSFTEALRVELASKSIVVAAVCPGPTPTNFGKNARRPDGTDTNREGQDLLRVMPGQVVRTGLRTLERDAGCVFPGLGVSAASTLLRVLPRKIMRWVITRRYLSSSK